ncbi:MAG: hypothetical protein HWN66_02985, partial [Candidatus Helarchaeota archaeon]|nr:hypothetical protein [Candidatus Helarchaeota archaeon]
MSQKEEHEVTSEKKNMEKRSNSTKNFIIGEKKIALLLEKQDNTSEPSPALPSAGPPRPPPSAGPPRPPPSAGPPR